MASGANAYLQMPTSAINKILAKNPKMFNAGLADDVSNSLSHLNQLNKANALANALATNNAAQAAEGQVPSLARKAGRIVGNGINATKGALGRVVMTPSLAALGGAAAEIVPVAGVVGSLGGAYASARGEQMDNDPVVQQEKAIRANAIKNGWTPDDEDNWTNAQGQTATYNDIYGMYGPEGTALGLPFENGTSMDIGLPPGNSTSTNIGSAPTVKQEAPTSTTSSPSFNQVVNGVIAGHYGNGKKRIANIAATGQDPAAVQKAVNAKMQGSKKAAPIRQANPEVPKLNMTGNWMDTLNSLLPYLALGAGAYYLGRRS